MRGSDKGWRMAPVLLALLPAALGAQTPTLTPPPAASDAARPLEGGPDFISPIGEPFHSEDRLSGAEHWYAGADKDRDGRLTIAEYLADADRFFARLDRDRDQEIEPAEIDIYESDIAPEIRVVSTGAQWQPRPDDGSDAPRREPYPQRLGAGRYSWIDVPEPIVSMDTNFDRGVSHREYSEAAKKRFNALDADHDGVLTRDELPKLEAARVGKRKRRGGD